MFSIHCGSWARSHTLNKTCHAPYSDTYKYEVCISLLKAFKIFTKWYLRGTQQSTMFFTYGVTFNIKSHVNNNGLQAQLGYLCIKTITLRFVKRENVPTLADYCDHFPCLFISFTIHGITPQNMHLLDAVFSYLIGTFETPCTLWPGVKWVHFMSSLTLAFYSGVTLNEYKKQTVEEITHFPRRKLAERRNFASVFNRWAIAMCFMLNFFPSIVSNLWFFPSSQSLIRTQTTEETVQNLESQQPPSCRTV